MTKDTGRSGIKHAIIRLQREIRDAIATRDSPPVNLGRFNHRAIVTALHPFVHHRSHRAQKRLVPTAHSDGSVGGHFPILCLPPAERQVGRQTPVLRIGLNSGRHLELDHTVDFYLVRNNETNDLENFSSQEELAYEATREVLTDSSLRAGGMLEAYHTGLEPLVIGFYRAVIDVALERRIEGLPSLVVRPMIFAPRPVRLQGLNNQQQKAVEQSFARLSEFFRVAADEDRTGRILWWRLSRPMTESERDEMARQLPALEKLIAACFSRTQYRNENIWGQF